eukprot:109291-Prorocentrum_minimum.AAC.1
MDMTCALWIDPCGTPHTQLSVVERSGWPVCVLIIRFCSWVCLTCNGSKRLEKSDHVAYGLSDSYVSQGVETFIKTDEFKKSGKAAPKKKVGKK